MLTRESVAGRLCTARGDFAAAATHFELAVKVREEVHAIEFAPAISAGLAELALWQQRPDEAKGHVAAGMEAIGDTIDPLHAPILFSIGMRAEADADARAGQRDPDGGERVREGGRLLARLDAAIERHRGAGGVPEAQAHRALAVAELARLRGEHVAQPWIQAADAWDALAAPYRAAYARWRAAEALLTAPGGRGDAVLALRAAVQAAGALAAGPLLQEINGLARRARLDLTSASEPAPERTRLPAEAEELGLTSRELEVLRLLALGLTDRQIGEHLFISARTAQVHVSRIRMKLDAETRTAAAGIAQRLGLVEL
jgi:DNA-binding CsgD family transcriptional regulator